MDMAKDPICGMTVDPARARASCAYKGTTVYFCCAGCATKFRADPDRYFNQATSGAAAAPSDGKLYTCPMHPEVVRSSAGSCPSCGMALEPVVPSASDGDEENAELTEMSQRL